jgi:hypothetical protein
MNIEHVSFRQTYAHPRAVSTHHYAIERTGSEVVVSMPTICDFSIVLKPDLLRTRLASIPIIGKWNRSSLRGAAATVTASP